MDGENNGKPYEQMDDLGVLLFSETSNYLITKITNFKRDQFLSQTTFLDDLALPEGLFHLISLRNHVGWMDICSNTVEQ